MHFIELVFWGSIILASILFLTWLGNRPTKKRFEELRTELDLLKQKEQKLKSDYKTRKKKASFFDKLSVDKSELNAVRDKISSIQPEYQRHAEKYCSETIEKRRRQDEKIEKVINVVDKGLKVKKIVDLAGKVAK